MTTTKIPANAELLTSIDAIALADVTGGCAACGQTCANGTPPTTAANPNKAGWLANAFSRR
jgi:hypothetical protein